MIYIDDFYMLVFLVVLLKWFGSCANSSSPNVLSFFARIKELNELRSFTSSIQYYFLCYLKGRNFAVSKFCEISFSYQTEGLNQN